ncbi:HugZ family pyridoxamine 5'-phosphate oxidase [Rhodopirellula sallentina]|uniref:Pyridoxamine 5'-phosphate oxidase-like FMN-binding protein n=1 Tax=Rhodopirellula sallentina SM41 TaxID=1263870 RepID=M5UQZ2_9BACT|nr:pyridoxamine 5'-phosphate oxidase family protein [Rhodopirellula sallentina]EMI58408.1 pyridoxamine 5'-phosphate oxidase-like FMN-binding protein [Rhodopirellula sallentina SM41]
MTDCTQAEIAGRIVRQARSACLGTIDRDGGPFVSLVNVAASVDSRPAILMLLSGLARHTKNLIPNPSASLLLTQSPSQSVTSDTDATADPLAGARVTLLGEAVAVSRDADASERATFLAAHESAAKYAGFGDFSFYRFEIADVHLVAGFGQISTFSPDELS